MKNIKAEMRNFVKYQFFLLMLGITPTSSCEGKDYIKISNGEIQVVVDIEVGGRVVEYSKNGNNVLFDKTSGDYKYSGPDGGRCDFGPERIAPPRPETWLGEWEVTEKKPNYIKIKSQVANAAGVQLIREFTLEPNSSHLLFKQTIINVSNSPKRYCHWSRTFGEPNGICLAPLNPESRYPKGYIVYTKDDKLDFMPEGGENEKVRNGILVVSGPPENAKIVTDASDGWLAYITRDNQLFVKKFEIFPDKFYGEMTGATVSLWYNEEGICEIEPIGPWEWINPGKSISFTENWYLTDFEYPENKEVDLKEIKEIIEKH
jgi:hypothetical protein